jgi:NAD(P)-dependent dehydrogenase (short-subunit alcohol dehydrogenase family)
MTEPRIDPFRDRVAVITGGAGGIGMAMARAFAARGAALVLADLDAEALERTAGELRRENANVLPVVTDVTQLDSVAALAEAARAHFGGVHIVCNNAGVALFGEMAKASHRDWVYTMNVNFWGVVHGVETFVPLLAAQGQGGHIVNTASMAGLVGMRWLGIYSASKFAVVGLSEALQREVKPLGIGVSVLCPMIVDTAINENSLRMRPSDLRNAGEEELVLPPANAMAGGTIPPAEVGRRVVRAIDRGDLYILTHPEQREILHRRAAKLDTMFKEEFW